jgi:iron complex outermembrane receptor protein
LPSPAEPPAAEAPQPEPSPSPEAPSILERVGSFQDIEDLDLETIMKASTDESGFAGAEEPGAVTVITEEDIRRTGARTVAEILETVPGLEVLTDNLGRNRIVVRGVPGGFSSGGSENVLVLLNGFKLNENVTGGATAVNLDIPVDNVKKIEVVRGPGSVLHGPGAFLAVIDIVTESVDTFRRDELTLRAGSFRSFLYNFRYGTTFRDVSLAGFLEYAYTGGPHLPIPSDTQTLTDRALAPLGVPPASRAPGETNDDRKAVDANLAVAWRRFHFNLRHKEENAGGFVGVLDALGTLNRLNTQQITVDGRYQQTLAGLGDLTVTAGLNRSESLRFLDILPPGFTLLASNGRTIFPGGVAVQETLNSQRLEAQAALERQVRAHHAVTVGAAVERESTYGLEVVTNLDFRNFQPLPRFQPLAGLYPDRTRTVVSLFAQDAWTPGRGVSVVGGLRAEDYTDYGLKVSPRVAATYRLPRDVSLKASWARAFRAPSFQERFYPTPELEVDPDLRRSRVDALDLGALYRRGDLQVTASAYYLAVRDAIGPRPLILPRGTARSRLANIEAVDGRGLELEATRSFTGGASVQLAYALQRPRYRDGALRLDSLPVPTHSLRLAGNLGVGEYVALSPSLTVRGARDRAPGDLRPDVGGYGLLDLVVRGRNFSPRWEVSASFHNLLGEDYFDPAPAGGLVGDYPRPGRSAFLKVRYRF